MFRVERLFFLLSWPRGNDAVHACAVGDDDEQDATGICFAQMDSACFAVADCSGGIERIVLNYLFRFFWCGVMAGDVFNVG